MSNLSIVCMGVGTVFVGLICIVILSILMSAICRATDRKNRKKAVVSAPAAPQTIENRQQIIAAVSAAVAEELGTDISAVRILSFRKI